MLSDSPALGPQFKDVATGRTALSQGGESGGNGIVPWAPVAGVRRSEVKEEGRGLAGSCSDW